MENFECPGGVNPLLKCQNVTVNEDRHVGTVTTGNDHQPICVPGNGTITVLGKVSKLVTQGSYMLDLAAQNN